MSTPLSDWSSNLYRKSWFLGIGINKYQHFSKLHNAVRDVEAILSTLTSRYDIQQENAFTLFDERANEDEIIATLERLAGEIAPGDKLLIYYSGHGHLNAKTHLAYWIPVNARQGVSADYIPNSTIRDHLSVIQAQHILLISDSCFSGSLLLTGSSRSSRAVVDMDRTPSRWALTSGRGNEEVYDGDPGSNSPFATSILEALESNRTDAWNVSRLVERVREQTAATTTQIPQGSPLRVEGHKGGQYVFRLKDSLVSQETLASNSTMTRTEPTDIQRPIEEPSSGVTGQKGESDLEEIKSIGKIIIWAFAIIAGVVLLIFVMIWQMGDSQAGVSFTQNSEEIYVDVGEKSTQYTLVMHSGADTLFNSGPTQARMQTIRFADHLTWPGQYQLVVANMGGTISTESVHIPQPNDVTVNILQTTSSVNQNLWPSDAKVRFAQGSTVFVYCNVSAQEDVELVVRWYKKKGDEWNLMANATTDLLATADQGQGLRLSTHKTISEAGIYQIRAYHNLGIVLAETTFLVE